MATQENGAETIKKEKKIGIKGKESFVVSKRKLV